MIDDVGGDAGVEELSRATALCWAAAMLAMVRSASTADQPTSGV